MHTGLPPTPIANPGRASIEAAVNPAPTLPGRPDLRRAPIRRNCHYLYYVVADEDGRHVFAATLEQHEVNVQHARDPRVARVISANTRVAAVIGSPVRHSLSPALHNAGFAATGVDWVYIAFEVEPGDARPRSMRCACFGLGGLSVTMPHKEDVAELVDELDPAAAALRSVNTVVPLGEGRLKGYSTDGAGFLASLAAQDVEVENKRVCVLGGGGAARAIVDALARAGAAAPSSLSTGRRTGERCASLAAAIGVVGEQEAIADCDLVVNATSVGMGSDELPCDAAAVARRLRSLPTSSTTRGHRPVGRGPRPGSADR